MNSDIYPLVSAIMPTRDRTKLAALAIDSFFSQSYPNKELVILDDLDDRSFPHFDPIMHPEGVIYRLMPYLAGIAEKRNLCVEYANGEIIMHFDSDDWSAPERMGNQVEALKTSGRAVTGYHSMLFHVEHQDRWVKYCGHHDFAIGTSLAYTKTFWLDHQFKNGTDQPNVGEDTLFVREAQRVRQVTATDAGAVMYARIHAGNTGFKDISKLEYRKIDPAFVPAVFVQSVKWEPGQSQI